MNELLNGLMLGGLYATVSLGLTLVFGVMRLVNLAHGELLVGSAYVSFFATTRLHIDPFLALLVVIPVMMLIAYPIQRVVLNPLLLRGLEPPLVATFGLSVAAQALFALLYTSDNRSLSASYDASGVTILGHAVRTIFVMGLGVGVVLVAAIEVMLMRSSFGKALRASAEDPEAAATLGINVRHVYAATFALAAAVSAFGGTLIGTAFSFEPLSGLTWLGLGFTVIVLGGIGSPMGALVGGVLVGLIQSYGAVLLGPDYRDIIVYSLLIVVLLVRPQGLLGKKIA